MDLSAVIIEVGRRLQSDFDVVSAQLKHAGEKGTHRENAIHQVLRDHLPPRFGVMRGEVFSVTKDHSHQSDCIVFDATVTPPAFARSGVVPTEVVWAVVESKTRLNKRALDDARQAAKALKHLLVIPPGPDLNEPKRPRCLHEIPPRFYPPVYVVVARTANKDTRELMKPLVDAWRAQTNVAPCAQTPPWADVPDCVVCLDGWVMCWDQPGAQTLHLVWADQRRPVLVRAGDQALLLFYGLLYEWLSEAASAPLPMSYYLQSTIKPEDVEDLCDFPKADHS